MHVGKIYKYLLLRLFCTLLLFCFGVGLKSTIVFADNGNVKVHITATGKCYHKAGCYHLRSDYEITLYEAVVENGYNPCEDCNPPIYDGPEPLHEKMEKTQGGSSSSSLNKKTTITGVTIETNSVNEENDNTATIVFCIIAAIVGVLIIRLFIIKLLIIIKRIRKKQAEKELYKRERNKYMEKYAHKDPITIVKVPEGSYVKEHLPCTYNAEKGIYGDYTVYVSPYSGKVLHTNSKCGGHNLVSINLYNARNMSYCKKCASHNLKNLPSIDWYIDYINIIEIKKKYEIP